ncbi:MAG: glycosyltransferase [Bacteroidetes bacterium]|nr:glycosyltransferase [Bacteroidota bacterium]
MQAFWIAAFVLLFFRISSFAVALVNFLTPVRLRGAGVPETARVSVLIPARNEEKNLPATLESLLNLKTDLHEIVILDDHSTDSTFQIADTIGRHEPKVKVLRGKPLPAGWTGKNWACHQLGLVATGTHFLFLDADVRPEKGSIGGALSVMETSHLGFLSVFPDQKLGTPGEKMVVPVMHHILLSLLPLILVKKTRFSSLSAANGQWMLFLRELYQTGRYHEAEKGSVAEDIRIARRVKSEGVSAACLLGGGLVSCRMYSGLRESLDGFSKNSIDMLGGTPASATILSVLLVLPPFFFFFLPWPVFFWIDLGLLLGSRILIAKLSGRSVQESLLATPALLFFLIYLVIKGFISRWTKTITWKGRTVES